MSELQVKTMAEFMTEGKEPDILFWVGSAGSFDDRAKKITKSFVKILNHVQVNFGVLEQKNLLLEMLLSVQEMNFFFKCRL